ncbi:MAG: CocE/NonD family hydrolase [Chitinophagaceae bacterium]|nr:MAG: CocE/NonD family hydrolase [Chitinophagaceae bacterium]
MHKLSILFLAFIFSLTGIAQNADSTWFVNNYIKKEVYIPMRDGIKLFTSFYIPKDNTEKHPFLMTRTPYSCAPYGEAYASIWKTYKLAYAKENYIFVTQDVRGRYMSEGVFEDVRPFNAKKKGKQTDEASDTYDAIDWMVKNITNNNGRAGVMGTSYPGFYSTQAALSGHPALKAVSPQAPVTDWFIGDDFHHNGAFFQMDAFGFYPSFGKPHPVPTQDYGSGFVRTNKDNYDFFLKAGTLKNLSSMIGDSIKFWHEMMEHPNYDDWWQARNARVGLYDVKPAMLWVGGLFDAEDCWGAWNSFKATEKQSPQTNNKIVMGPWYHGQWSREGSFLGNVRFESNTSDYFQTNIEIPFFQYHLKGKGSVAELAKASVFFTGENKWKTFDQWPAKNATNKKLFLEKDSRLGFSSSANVSFEYSYLSDPAKPVPYTEDVHNSRTREYMTDDQRFASRRPDVLTFEMNITEDLTVAGPVIANLMTSISTTDADFVVKLIDVFPEDFSYPATSLGNGKEYPMGGYQMLVRGEIMRGRFRNSFSKPEAFEPNKPTSVKFELPDVAHTFKKGHKLMIQIQSSWFPLADRNPQKFVDIYKATESDFQKATINILPGTYFDLPVLKN